tara:strand:+ start:516 stop:800 length:285 start_codon:yes stop_codon:yes gene_type:complete
MNKKIKKTIDPILDKDKSNEPLDCNGNPIDPKRKYIGNKFKVPMFSPNSSFYKNNSTIILFGGNGQQKPEQTPKSKFEDFLSRAPISFDQNEEV